MLTFLESASILTLCDSFDVAEWLVYSPYILHQFFLTNKYHQVQNFMYQNRFSLTRVLFLYSTKFQFEMLTRTNMALPTIVVCICVSRTLPQKIDAKFCVQSGLIFALTLINTQHTILSLTPQQWNHEPTG